VEILYLAVCKIAKFIPHFFVSREVEFFKILVAHAHPVHFGGKGTFCGGNNTSKPPLSTQTGEALQKMLAPVVLL